MTNSKTWDAGITGSTCYTTAPGPVLFFDFEIGNHWLGSDDVVLTWAWQSARATGGERMLTERVDQIGLGRCKADPEASEAGRSCSRPQQVLTGDTPEAQVI